MEKLVETINNCWDEAVKRILESPEFSDRQKDLFNKLINKGPRNLTFKNIEDAEGGTIYDIYAQLNKDCEDQIWDPQEQKWVKRILEDRFFKRLVDFVARKLANGDTNWDDFRTEFEKFIAILIHEMGHRYGGFIFPNMGDRQAECMTECMVYILTGIAGRDLQSCHDYCKFLHSKCLEAAGCSGKNKHPWASDHEGNHPKYWKPDTPDDSYTYASNLNNDNADENNIPINNERDSDFSSNISSNNLSFNYYPDVLIFNKFETVEMENLLNQLIPDNSIDDYNHDFFPTSYKVLVIPSGELMGDSGSGLIRESLKRFVAVGNSLVVFSQQFGTEIENLIPYKDGDLENAMGFREDGSCLKNSAYFIEMHPILSSSTRSILDVGLDGYYSISTDSSAHVLLRRKINHEPALLYYKYGQGTIFLTSLFSDFAYSKSMASTEELKLVKNLVRFAQDPDSPIPMVDMANNPDAEIKLIVRVSNDMETPAANARISVYTIENTPVYETEAPVNLNKGDSAEIPITFPLPPLEDKNLGIGYTLFELEDAEGNIIQLEKETPSGRFAIYKLITPADINGGVLQWITVKDETVYWGQELACTLHIKNITDQTRQLAYNAPNFSINHGFPTIPLDSFSVTLAPGESYNHVVFLPTSRLDHDYDGNVTFQIFYSTPDGNRYRFGAKKGIFLKKSWLKSWVQVNTPARMAPGGSFNYTAAARSDAPLAGETAVRLVLLKHDSSTGDYTEIKTLFQDTHDFSVVHDYNYTATYTPVPVHPSGLYHLQLEIIAPNGFTERSPLETIYYSQSGFNASPGHVTKPGSSEPERYLIPGETYSFPVSISNSSPSNDYHVTDGNLILRLISATNREIYRKEITGINIASDENIEQLETFLFNPGETGPFTLEFLSRDETSYAKPSFKKSQVFWYYTAIGLESDKTMYDYMDTAHINVRIDGVGSYLLHFTCAEAGIDEIRSVQVPDGSFSTSELFQVPIVSLVPGVFNPVYNIQVRTPGSFQKFLFFD